MVKEPKKYPWIYNFLWTESRNSSDVSKDNEKEKISQGAYLGGIDKKELKSFYQEQN